ncbi:MAG: hypothetical protein PHE21_03230 [Candidatus Dojkabacteria bacterium]|nr:hypothetical protein [Candidatus Dojkabacteria bacterium]
MKSGKKNTKILGNIVTKKATMPKKNDKNSLFGFFISSPFYTLFFENTIIKNIPIKNPISKKFNRAVFASLGKWNRSTAFIKITRPKIHNRKVSIFSTGISITNMHIPTTDRILNNICLGL